MKLLSRATRNLFFTGKGGVGKTSTSCAIAVRLAEHGKSVLLVSTDPASNLDEVFAMRLGPEARAVEGVPGLFALNVDPEAAAAAYRERVVGPYRSLLPADAVASIEEQLAGACTVEIAAFDEFAKLLGDERIAKRYDHIVFDTAPTGHTLRLLSLPAAWTGFIGKSAAGTSCLGPLQGLVAQKALYEAAVAALSDASLTTMVLVSRPEPASLEEAERSSAELATIGVENQMLVINGVFQSASATDPIAAAMQRMARVALSRMPSRLARLERETIPLKARQVVGLDALRRFFTSDPEPATPPAPSEGEPIADIGTLVEQLAAQPHGVVMTMGKGGVGKTSIAAYVATALARRGLKVHLTTTDPASHIKAAVGEWPASLTVGEINPSVEVARYRQDVMSTTGAKLDASGKALLEEDLSSPCTEEVAVFQAFARVVAEANDRIVVVDTAPTGHTILLLDAAQAYHREVMRQARGVSDAVRNLLPRLRDRSFTRIVLCTLAEATPVHEAAALQSDLRRAGIEPYAWVINQSLVPLHPTDALLVSRRAQETRYIDEILRDHSTGAFLNAWSERWARTEAQAAQAA